MSKSQLIDENGQPQYGYFDNGIDEINYWDFDLRTAMDRRRSHWSRRWRFNQFQFISLSCSQWLMGLAIVDLKFASTAFVYIVDLDAGDIEEFNFTQALARNTCIEPQPENGNSHFFSGKNSLKIESHGGQRNVSINVAGKLKLDASIDDRRCQNPLSLCCRNGYQGWTYTHKNAALPCSGSLHWRGRSVDLMTNNTLASVDWSGGFMRRETSWNWASISAHLPDGRRLGLNLATGVNESGFSENRLWLNGQSWPIAAIDFQFKRDKPDSPWLLRSADGRLQLEFIPRQCRKEKINLLILASNFRQYIGQFRGLIHLDSETLQLSGIWGLVEDHYAKW